MNNKVLYWSYAETPLKDSIVIEHTLKYADVDQIRLILKKYGKDKCQQVWERTLIPDERLKKLNHFLAKFIFKISYDNDVINSYLELNNKKRIKRIDEILNH